MNSSPSTAASGVRTATASPEVLNRARSLVQGEAIREVLRRLKSEDTRVLSEQRELTEIPAPPFGEEARALRMAELLRDAGLVDVELDGAGNVVALPPGAGGSGHGGEDQIVVSAHLDTVFPVETDVRVRQKGDRLVGPGISDDGRGLAALLALGRVLASGLVQLTHPTLLVATVGEEGTGDLRGVRHLFGKEGRAQSAEAFLSLDGAGLNRIVSTGLGSRRFRVTALGPGGHSWVNWGTPNPIHALGAAISRWTHLSLPVRPTTTLTVARWGGGTSINAIPQEAWLELELRCVSEQVLEGLEARFRKVLDAVITEANANSDSAGGLRVEVHPIGHRPAGETDTASALVRSAVAATRVLGGAPELAASSTDANLPMSLGIPAITMGAGGEAGQAHTTEEWYRNVQGPEGILRALLTLVLVDEIS